MFLKLWGESIKLFLGMLFFGLPVYGDALGINNSWGKHFTYKVADDRYSVEIYQNEKRFYLFEDRKNLIVFYKDNSLIKAYDRTDILGNSQKTATWYKKLRFNKVVGLLHIEMNSGTSIVFDIKTGNRYTVGPKTLFFELDVELARSQCSEYQSDSCYRLAKIYKNGIVVYKDMTLSKKYFQKACVFGNGYACIDVLDIAMRENVQKSIILYDEKCQQGDTEKCALLGYVYSEGYGVKKDIKSAVDYYDIACDIGEDMESCFRLAELLPAYWKRYPKQHTFNIRTCVTNLTHSPTSRKKQYLIHDQDYFYGKACFGGLKKACQ